MAESDSDTESIAILLRLEQQEFERRARQSEKSLQRLEARYDPLMRAQSRLTREQAQLDRALAAGKVTQERYNVLLGQAKAQYEQTATAIRSANNVIAEQQRKLGSMPGVFERNKGAVQQLGYQVGDFAVQVGNGTSAFTAFAQQGSQMLGVFGPLGAVMGAVLAIGAPLAAAFLANGEEADSLTDSLSKLSDAVADYKSAVEAVGTPTHELAAKYGDLASRAAEFMQVTREISRIRSDEAMKLTARTIGGELGVNVAGLDPDQIRDIQGALEKLGAERRKLQMQGDFVDDDALAKAQARFAEINEQIKSLQGLQSGGLFSSGIGDLAKSLGLTQEEAAEVTARFAEIGTSAGPKQAADAMLALVDYISDASGNLKDADANGKELYDQLIDAATKALEFASVDMASNLKDAADEAKRLSDNMPDVSKRIQAGMDAEAYGGAQDSMRAALAKLQIGGDLGDVDPAYGRAQDAAEKASSRSGLKAKNQQARDKAQWIEKYSTDLEKLQTQMQELNQLNDAGAFKDTPEIYTRALKDLNAQIDATQFKGLVDGIDSVSDAIGQNIGDWDGMRSAVMSSLDSIRSDIVSSGIDTALKSLLKSLTGGASSGGGVGGFLGSVVSSFIGKNASGTPSWRGGLTSVNERGGEIMNLPRGTQIIPHDISKRMADRSAGAGTVVQVVNNSGQPVAQQRSTGPSGEEIVQIQVGKTIASGKADKALMARSGVRPKVTSR